MQIACIDRNQADINKLFAEARKFNRSASCSQR
jgi:hypothetical protein